MRRQAATLALAFLAGNSIPPAGVALHSQKPTERFIVHTYSREPPPSLTEMKREAEAVVLGRIADATPKDGGFRRKSEPGITTYHRLTVKEVVQWSGRGEFDANELSIIRDGGILDRGNRIEELEVDDFPQFRVGHDYVLFLQWHPEHGGWTPAWGPHGTFEVIAGKVFSIGSAKIAKEQEGLTLDQFLRRLRESPRDEIALVVSRWAWATGLLVGSCIRVQRYDDVAGTPLASTLYST